MNRDQLRQAQAPLKEKYKRAPESALITLRALGVLGEAVTCNVETASGRLQAGLHPATAGNGLATCPGDMLLQALVGCAGVTLNAVATALGISVRGAKITVEGDVDFRGTLAVAKDVPVGFKHIRLLIELDSDASANELEKLVELTERYCVVYQTLVNGVTTTVEHRVNQSS